MSYSCTDFVDSILEALGIEGPDDPADNTEWQDSPSMQADSALAEIERLHKIEKEAKKMLAVLRRLNEWAGSKINHSPRS